MGGCIWEGDDVRTNRCMLQKGVVTHTKAIKARLLSDLQQLGITGLILVEVVVVLPVHDNFL